MSRHRDPRNPDMSPDENAAYAAWWGNLTLQGDPIRRPWLLKEAFHASLAKAEDLNAAGEQARAEGEPVSNPSDGADT